MTTTSKIILIILYCLLVVWFGVEWLVFHTGPVSSPRVLVVIWIGCLVNGKSIMLSSSIGTMNLDGCVVQSRGVQSINTKKRQKFHVPKVHNYLISIYQNNKFVLTNCKSLLHKNQFLMFRCKGRHCSRLVDGVVFNKDVPIANNAICRPTAVVSYFLNMSILIIAVRCFKSIRAL